MSLRFPSLLGEVAAQADQAVYLVGGAVRDLLLGLPITDYDLLLEEDAIGFAQVLQQRGLAELISVHRPFGTAKIRWLAGGQTIDLATTRRESYPYPGALPQVRYPAKIEEDLARRDFRINAIALRFGAEAQPIDLFGGQEDLQKGYIRTLHPRSYWEDPTRLLRAARFAARFGFSVAEEDLVQAQEALQDPQLHTLIQRVRGVRVGIELKRLLELDSWETGGAWLKRLGAWTIIRKELSIAEADPNYPLSTWETRLYWLLQQNSEEQVQQILKEIGVRANSIKNFKDLNALTYLFNCPTLRGSNRFAKLPPAMQSLYFALHPGSEKIWQKIEGCLPSIEQLSPDERTSGKKIQESLERRFQECLRET